MMSLGEGRGGRRGSYFLPPGSIAGTGGDDRDSAPLSEITTWFHNLVFFLCCFKFIAPPVGIRKY